MHPRPCMRLIRVFQIGVEGRDSPTVEGMENFAGGGDLICMVVGTWGEVILTIRTLFKAKNNIL